MIENGNDRELPQRDLSALELCEETWQMRLKCVMLRICNKKKPIRKTDYQLHGHSLEVLDPSKYPTTTEDLSWYKHIQNTVSKGFERRNLRDCTPPVKASTYKIIVCPILEYASPGWDPHQQGNIKALEPVQRRTARYVINDFIRTLGCITKMLDYLEWESLEALTILGASLK